MSAAERIVSIQQWGICTSNGIKLIIKYLTMSQLAKISEWVGEIYISALYLFYSFKLISILITTQYLTQK